LTDGGLIRRRSPIMGCDVSFARSPQEQAGAYEAKWRTGGAAAVAAQIPGVSRRTVYRSAPVMEAREDLQWRRETPGS
jgi:hypothetical protein